MKREWQKSRKDNNIKPYFVDKYIYLYVNSILPENKSVLELYGAIFNTYTPPVIVDPEEPIVDPNKDPNGYDGVRVG